MTSSPQPGAEGAKAPSHPALGGAPPAPAETAVLLSQYQVVAQHHIQFMGLIWQIPALAGAVGGTLVAFTYGRDMPGFVRVLVLGIGSVVLLVMTIALERYRMFQLRRRRDLEDLEHELLPRGGRRIVWGGHAIVAEIRRGEFRPGWMLFLRWEGFTALRLTMYFVTLAVLTTCVLAAAEAIGLVRLR